MDGIWGGFRYFIDVVDGTGRMRSSPSIRVCGGDVGVLKELIMGRGEIAGD